MQKRIIMLAALNKATPVVVTKSSKNGFTKNYGPITGFGGAVLLKEKFGLVAPALVAAAAPKSKHAAAGDARVLQELKEPPQEDPATRRARKILNEIFPGSGLLTGQHLVIGPPIIGPVVLDEDDCWELPPVAQAIAAVGEDIAAAITTLGTQSGLGEVAKAVPKPEGEGDEEAVFELPPPPPAQTGEDDFGFELPPPKE